MPADSLGSTEPINSLERHLKNNEAVPADVLTDVTTIAVANPVDTLAKLIVYAETVDLTRKYLATTRALDQIHLKRR